MIDALTYNARAEYEALHPIDRASIAEFAESQGDTPVGPVRCRVTRVVAGGGLEWAERFWLDDQPVTIETLRVRMAQLAGKGDPVLTWMRYRLEVGVTDIEKPTTSELYRDFTGWAGFVRIEGWTIPAINTFSSRLQAAGVVIKRAAYGATARNVLLLPKPTIAESEAMREEVRNGK